MAGDGGRVPDVSEQRAEGHEADVEPSTPFDAFICPVCGHWVPARGAHSFFTCDGQSRMERNDEGDFVHVPRPHDPISAVRVALSRCPSVSGAELPSRAHEAGDPASVLAALLAESPEATVAALEALLGERADMRPFPMQDGPPIPWCVAEAIHTHLYRYSQSLEDIGRRGGFGWPEVGALWNPPHSNHAQRVACRDAVCRSLLSKAPKEDG